MHHNSFTHQRIVLTRVSGVLLISLFALAFSSIATAQTTWEVPGDFETIQEGIDAASDGDEIVVFPGTYNEAINFNGKAIHLRSSDGPEETTIDATGLEASVVTCMTGEGNNTILEGFAVTGGAAQLGGGMLNSNASPTVIGCIFTENIAAWGGGMANIAGSAPVVLDTFFLSNTAEAGGGGMLNGSSTVTVIGCVFEENVAGGEGGGMFNEFIALVEIEDTLFCGNVPDNIVGPWNDLSGNVFCPPAALHVPQHFPTIQHAIDAVVDHTEIVVAPGTYNEAIDFLGKAIHLRSSDGPEVTIIDGSGLNTSVVTCASGEGPETILDGFNVTGGTGTPIGSSTRGGGMYNNNGSSPTVINCIFQGNSATFGGGIYNRLGSSPTITDCKFIANTANDGAGLRNFNSSSPHVQNCLFQDNVASDRGGGMTNNNDSSPLIENCVFESNTASERGGGMTNLDNSNPTISDCVFRNNRAGSAPNMVHTGGGMYNVGSSPLITQCIFEGNYAGQGGGGIYNSNDSNAQIIECEFIANVAGGGGGMSNLASSPTVVDCTFRGNVAYAAGGAHGGGGIRNVGQSNTTIIDCVFRANSTLSNTALMSGAILNSNSDIAITGSEFCNNAMGNIFGDWDDEGRNELLTLCPDSEPAIVGVPTDYPTIQFAINDSPAGSEIVVAPGVYAEHISLLGKEIHLRSSNGPEFTILTGSGDNRVIRVEHGEGDYTAIEGFTITNENSAFSNSQAMRISNNSKPTIRNCVFKENSADEFGGALSISSSNPLLENCVFTANSAKNGGAMSVHGGSNVVVENCMFTDNSAWWPHPSGGSGGAIYISHIGAPMVSLESCTFSNNEASYLGPGMRIRVGANVDGSGSIGDGTSNVGQLRPGGAEAAMARVDGDYRQRESAVTGSLLIDLGGTISESEHDLLEVTGTADLGGLLNVSFINDFTPSLGDAFTILAAHSIVNPFDVTAFPTMPPGLVMRVNYEQSAAVGGGQSVVLTVEELATLLGFGDPAMVGLDGAATSVATGDFNQNEHLDIALTLRGATPSDPGSVLVLFNDGTGESFSGAQYTVGAEPSDIAVADLTGDGRLDIAVTNGGENSVSVLLNTLDNGETTFELQPPIGVGAAPSAIVAADLRGIGVIDLAVTNAGEDTVHILHNTDQGDGTFDFVQSVAVGPTPSDIISAPLVGGGIDLAVTNMDADPNPEVGDPEPAVMILGNDGSGAFTVDVELFGGLGPGGLGAEDLDNNRDIDLVAINGESNDATIFKNLGGGNFSPAVSIPIGGSPQSMTILDMDQDGTADLAIVVDDPEQGLLVRILRNDTPPGSPSLIFSFDEDLADSEDENPILITSGDVTGNGADDLITINAEPDQQPISGDGGGGGGGGAVEQSSVNIHPNLLGQPACPADISGPEGVPDGVVDVFDLLMVISDWGECIDPNSCPADLTGPEGSPDGVVDVFDLLKVISEWGACPQMPAS